MRTVWLKASRPVTAGPSHLLEPKSTSAHFAAQPVLGFVAEVRSDHCVNRRDMGIRAQPVRVFSGKAPAA